jgi:hypothetical protein
VVSRFEDVFPGLTGRDYRITSPANRDYNCVAWAVGDTGDWWWPGPHVEIEYWPAGIPREVTLFACRELFASLGYVACDSEELEPGFEKIALFANTGGKPGHAARQLPEGRWASKVGKLEDIEHGLHDLAGEVYGSVVQIMKRPIPETKPAGVPS